MFIPGEDNRLWSTTVYRKSGVQRKGEETHRGARFIGQTVLNRFPADQGVVGQVMREAEGLDVFLKARRYDPLVPPELVALQIRSHFREESLDLHKLRVRDLNNFLASLGPLGHDAVEEKDEFLGVVRDISIGLIKERVVGRNATICQGFRSVGVVC